MLAQPPARSLGGGGRSRAWGCLWRTFRTVELASDGPGTTHVLTFISNLLLGPDCFPIATGTFVPLVGMSSSDKSNGCSESLGGQGAWDPCVICTVMEATCCRGTGAKGKIRSSVKGLGARMPPRPLGQKDRGNAHSSARTPCISNTFFGFPF